MSKTIGQMIQELEETLGACREIDRLLAIWKFAFERADESKQREMLKEMLSTCGFSEEQIGTMLVPNKLLS